MSFAQRRMQLKIPTRRDAKDYWRFVLEIAPANLVAYWPLTADSGNADLGPSGYTLTPTAITYTAATATSGGVPNFGMVSTYDGASSRYVIPEALENTMNFNLGTLMVWWMHPAALWGDATARRIIVIGEDTNNRLIVNKGNAANRFQAYRLANANINSPFGQIDMPSGGGVWHCCIYSWNSVSTTNTRVYNDGASIISGNNANTYTGGITPAVIGASIGASFSGSNPMAAGSQIAHVVIWNRQLSAAEIAALYAKGWA